MPNCHNLSKYEINKDHIYLQCLDPVQISKSSTLMGCSDINEALRPITGRFFCWGRAGMRVPSLIKMILLTSGQSLIRSERKISKILLPHMRPDSDSNPKQ